MPILTNVPLAHNITYLVFGYDSQGTIMFTILELYNRSNRNNRLTFSLRLAQSNARYQTFFIALQDLH